MELPSHLDVLLIHGSTDVRRAVAAAIAAVDGWTVQHAGDAAAGVRAARIGRPDVVLVDLRLPAHGGDGVSRLLRGPAATRNIPLVYLASRASRSTGNVIAEPLDAQRLPGLIVGGMLRSVRWADGTGVDVDGPLRAALEAIWRDHRHDLEAHVNVVAAGVAAAQRGCLSDEVRLAARGAAHALVGAGGTFGQPVITELGRELEEAFARSSSAEKPCLEVLSSLVDTLRLELAGED